MNDRSKEMNQKNRLIVLSSIGGVLSFLTLWMLTFFEALHPLLFAPLSLINKASWSFVGWKLIPDGGPSTLFVSSYFLLVGVVVVLIVASLRICAKMNSDFAGGN
ncbi:MAG: hypothetical protein KA118_12165 [Verrucomicrobia bacterium]|nr:hypothetical protein [Verrucomicrobiota bacterium]